MQFGEIRNRLTQSPYVYELPYWSYHSAVGNVFEQRKTYYQVHGRDAFVSDMRAYLEKMSNVFINYVNSKVNIELDDMSACITFIDWLHFCMFGVFAE